MQSGGYDLCFENADCNSNRNKVSYFAKRSLILLFCLELTRLCSKKATQFSRITLPYKTMKLKAEIIWNFITPNFYLCTFNLLHVMIWINCLDRLIPISMDLLILNAVNLFLSNKNMFTQFTSLLHNFGCTKKKEI